MEQNLRDKYYANNTQKKILALDGGGVRGALTLGYLEKIETLLRERENNADLVLADYYDLIGGTSTGAIIAACLAKGKSVAEIITLYQKLGKEVFGDRTVSIVPRDWTTFRALFKSTYKADVIEKVLKENLGETTLGDYGQLKCPLVIMSKRADTYSLWTVGNHPDGIYTEAMAHLKLWELCRASSAAPYYFPAKKLTLKTRKMVEFDAVFIDGGVSLANNPVLQLFLTATIPSFGFKWQPGEDRLYITSLGTGAGVNKDSVEDITCRRAVAWAPKIPELFMTDAQEMSQVVLQLFGRNETDNEVIDSQYLDLKDVNYYEKKLFSFARFNVKLTADYLKEKLGMTVTADQIASLVEMDHYENIDQLLTIGRKAAETMEAKDLPQ